MQNNSNLATFNWRIQSRTGFVVWFILLMAILLMSFAITRGGTPKQIPTDFGSMSPIAAPEPPLDQAPSPVLDTGPNPWLHVEAVADEPNIRLSAREKFDWVKHVREFARSRHTEPLERTSHFGEESESGLEVLNEKKCPADTEVAGLKTAQPVGGWIVLDEKQPLDASPVSRPSQCPRLRPCPHPTKCRHPRRQQCRSRCRRQR